MRSIYSVMEKESTRAKVAFVSDRYAMTTVVEKVEGYIQVGRNEIWCLRLDTLRVQRVDQRIRSLRCGQLLVGLGRWGDDGSHYTWFGNVHDNIARRLISNGRSMLGGCSIARPTDAFGVLLVVSMRC